MKIQLIKGSQRSSNHLIIYFAGWATPPEVVLPLSIPPNYDVLLCSDYRDLNFSFDFSLYPSIHLVAWSMGVWVAEQLMSFYPLKTATAINGTPLPYHDEFGIPCSVFEGTLQHLSPVTRTKFERRMCGNHMFFQHYQQFPPIAFEQAQQELQSLYEHLKSTQGSTQRSLAWTRALIGTQDRIFPAEHVKSYWSQKNIPTVEIEAPHYLFPYYSRWEDLW